MLLSRKPTVRCPHNDPPAASLYQHESKVPAWSWQSMHAYALCIMQGIVIVNFMFETRLINRVLLLQRRTGRRNMHMLSNASLPLVDIKEEHKLISEYSSGGQNFQ
jgi:hypothetical protein